MHLLLPCPCVQVTFRLQGEGGLIEFVEERLAKRGHIVVCLAAGAGYVSAVCVQQHMLVVTSA